MLRSSDQWNLRNKEKGKETSLQAISQLAILRHVPGGALMHLAPARRHCSKFLLSALITSFLDGIFPLKVQLLCSCHTSQQTRMITDFTPFLCPRAVRLMIAKDGGLTLSWLYQLLKRINRRLSFQRQKEIDLQNRLLQFSDDRLSPASQLFFLQQTCSLQNRFPY